MSLLFFICIYIPGKVELKQTNKQEKKKKTQRRGNTPFSEETVKVNKGKLI